MIDDHVHSMSSCVSSEIQIKSINLISSEHHVAKWVKSLIPDSKVSSSNPHRPFNEC